MCLPLTSLGGGRTSRLFIKSPKFKRQPPMIPACRGGRWTDHHGLDSQWPLWARWPPAPETSVSLQVMLGGWLSPQEEGRPTSFQPPVRSPGASWELFSDALTSQCPGHACFCLLNRGLQKCHVVLSRMVSAIGKKLRCWAH